MLTLPGEDLCGAFTNAELTICCSALLFWNLDSKASDESTVDSGVQVAKNIDISASWDLGLSRTVEDGKTYLLPVGNKSNEVDGYCHVRGLVLEPTYKEPGQFRRVGVFTSSQEDMAQLAHKLASLGDDETLNAYQDKDGIIKDDGIARKVITLF